MDVTVINSLHSATVKDAVVTPGHALEVRYGTKMTGAAEACLREGIRFIPMVVEALGGWHPVAIMEVKKLAAAKARHAGQEGSKPFATPSPGYLAPHAGERGHPG